ncbi:hypothetical protein [Gracilinema caldarium]|uniref:hypothetical protein n=1 Tax=Gracilinema caldarium TaxID=215591 RepID=UPI0026EAB6EF|nr:hypothetical protein [Gracilinema caldarium]
MRSHLTTKHPLWAIVCLSLSIFGCSTVPVQQSKQTTDESEQIQKALSDPARIPSLYASLECKAGDEIKAFDSGEIITDFAPLPEGILNPVVLQVQRPYYYHGKEQKSTFELIYFPMVRTNHDQSVKEDQIIGKTLGTKLNVILRSSTLNPLMISVSITLPVRYNGYFYYTPGLYVSSVMKWLLFPPIEETNFEAMYKHALETPESLLYFNTWCLYKTSLQDYPTPFQQNNKELYYSRIYYKDIPIDLIFQPGFLKYLKDEYTLGTPIYLYLQTESIFGNPATVRVWVRDFSLKSPDDIVDDKIKVITK